MRQEFPQRGRDQKSLRACGCVTGASISRKPGSCYIVAHHSEEEASRYGLRQFPKPHRGSKKKEGGTRPLHLRTLPRSVKYHLYSPGLEFSPTVTTRRTGSWEFLILFALYSVKNRDSIVEKCICIVRSLTSPKEESGHCHTQ